MSRICPCGSEILFSNCCEPYILQQKNAPNPEALMRSRYSAYVNKTYAYIVNTYALASQSSINAADIAASSENTVWLKLEVLSAYELDAYGEIEFIAYYQLGQHFYAMHELSRFTKENSQWRYLNGDVLDKSGRLKMSRNESCLCGSGRKYKHCCGV